MVKPVSPWRQIWGHHLNQLLGHAGRALRAPCALCGEHGRHIVCPDCYHRHLNAVETRCTCCALPLIAKPVNHQEASTTLCGDCLKHPPHFDRSISAMSYSAPTDQLILSLKFRHQLSIAPLLANALRDAVLREPEMELPDLLTVVPLSSRRLIERGFNQSLEIAKPFARLIGVPLLPTLLQRQRNTIPQSSLHPDQRHQNIRHAFTLDFLQGAKIHGKHIGVVDDVMTTGATCNEIAGILKQYGAVKVSNLIVARTARH